MSYFILIILLLMSLCISITGKYFVKKHLKIKKRSDLRLSQLFTLWVLSIALNLLSMLIGFILWFKGEALSALLTVKLSDFIELFKPLFFFDIKGIYFSINVFVENFDSLSVSNDLSYTYALFISLMAFNIVGKLIPQPRTQIGTVYEAAVDKILFMHKKFPVSKLAYRVIKYVALYVTIFTLIFLKDILSFINNVFTERYNAVSLVLFFVVIPILVFILFKTISKTDLYKKGINFSK